MITAARREKTLSARLPVQVSERVTALIKDRNLAAGVRLPAERDLCEQFGVSRTVLREAMRLLEQKGLIEVHHGRGVFVAQKGMPAALATVSEHLQEEALSFNEIVESRRHLEVYIAELAAKRRTEQDIRALADRLSAMERSIELTDEFLREDLLFHAELARASKNRINELWLQPIMQVLIATRRTVSSMRPVRQRVLACHHAIYEAVRDADSERAGAAVEAHIQQFIADTDLARDLGML
jgi:GntR family transcriptional repressor for pyruvate dehydrogenase complex